MIELKTHFPVRLQTNKLQVTAQNTLYSPEPLTSINTRNKKQAKKMNQETTF